MARWPLAARLKNPPPPISGTLDRSSRVLNRGASGVVTILPTKEGTPRGGLGTRKLGCNRAQTAQQLSRGRGRRWSNVRSREHAGGERNCLKTRAFGPQGGSKRSAGAASAPRNRTSGLWHAGARLPPRSHVLEPSSAILRPAPAPDELFRMSSMHAATRA